MIKLESEHIEGKMDQGFALQMSTREEKSALKNLVLLKSFCRLSEIHLLFGRARLFPDWIAISGWSLSGYYHERILLNTIERVEWKSDHRTTPVLLLFLREGDTKEIRMRGAAVWKFAIDERISSERQHALILRSNRKYAHHCIYTAPVMAVR